MSDEERPNTQEDAAGAGRADVAEATVAPESDASPTGAVTDGTGGDAADGQEEASEGGTPAQASGGWEDVAPGTPAETAPDSQAAGSPAQEDALPTLGDTAAAHDGDALPDLGGSSSSALPPLGGSPSPSASTSPSDNGGLPPLGGAPNSPALPKLGGKDKTGSSSKPHKLTRRTAIIVGCAVAAAAGVAVGVGLHLHNERVAEEERQAEIEAHDAYVDLLEKAASDMLQGAGEAETTCNLINQVWYSAIWYDRRSEWDSDIRDYYSTDFNTSLVLLFASSEYKGHTSKIESYTSDVEADMRGLTDPPDDCEEAYDTVKDLYQQYSTLTDLATDPSGSLTSFHSSFSDADDDFMSAYNLLQTQIPDKMGD